MEEAQIKARIQNLRNAENNKNITTISELEDEFEREEVTLALQAVLKQIEIYQEYAGTQKLPIGIKNVITTLINDVNSGSNISQLSNRAFVVINQILTNSYFVGASENAVYKRELISALYYLAIALGFNLEDANEKYKRVFENLEALFEGEITTKQSKSNLVPPSITNQAIENAIGNNNNNSVVDKSLNNISDQANQLSVTENIDEIRARQLEMQREINRLTTLINMPEMRNSINEIQQNNNNIDNLEEQQDAQRQSVRQIIGDYERAKYNLPAAVFQFLSQMESLAIQLGENNPLVPYIREIQNNIEVENYSEVDNIINRLAVELPNFRSLSPSVTLMQIDRIREIARGIADIINQRVEQARENSRIAEIEIENRLRAVELQALNELAAKPIGYPDIMNFPIPDILPSIPNLLNTGILSTPASWINARRATTILVAFGVVSGASWLFYNGPQLEMMKYLINETVNIGNPFNVQKFWSLLGYGRYTSVEIDANGDINIINTNLKQSAKIKTDNTVEYYKLKPSSSLPLPSPSPNPNQNSESGIISTTWEWIQWPFTKLWSVGTVAVYWLMGWTYTAVDKSIAAAASIAANTINAGIDVIKDTTSGILSSIPGYIYLIGAGVVGLIGYTKYSGKK